MAERPDPDSLLARIKQDAARAQRGKLKIFFGASAGVGKTFAMLAAAQALRKQHIDVVIGVIETHGRRETAALLEGFEILPQRTINYRERVLHEFDLDAALARQPALLLVDELAHTNAAGSRHPKRWQDIEELIAAGIDVFTTVNVQHLESLNDVIGTITGIRVWETVPDHVLDSAAEVVIVDVAPDELLQRLRDGKIYLPQQAERAVNNFFRKGNLIALRELALRRVADRVDDEVRAYRRDSAVTAIWQTRESLLACIGADGGAEKIIRSAARLAAQLDVPWHVIYVETPQLQRLASAARKNILQTLKLAQELGAETATLPGNDVATTIVAYARGHNLARVLVGRKQATWRWRKSCADRLAQLGSELDITQIAGESLAQKNKSSLNEAKTTSARTRPIAWKNYAFAAAICAAATGLAATLFALVELTNIAMIFLLAVVLVAAKLGRGPAVFIAFLNVAVFDFFFVEPRFSMAVSDAQYLITFGVMLLVALLIGELTANLNYQARVAINREARANALSGLARELSGALMLTQVAEIAGRYIENSFNTSVAVVLADAEDKLGAPLFPAGSRAAFNSSESLLKTNANAHELDAAILQWVFDRGEAAGPGTDTLPASAILYLPLRAPMRIRGVLAIVANNSRWLMIPEQRRQLETFAALIAIAIERIHYVDIAQSTTVQIESERLRNSLLASLSHDLRTPLAGQLGAAEALLMTAPSLSIAQVDIVDSIRHSALRMNTLVNNLLDMSRLQSGEVKLNRQWQPLEEVIGAALANTKIILAAHHLVINLPADLPLVEFDAVLMERVFENILDNAHKYTPPGTRITISARAKAQTLEIIIEDDGPGLALGSEEAIFKKFTRGESNKPGVGLGLSICRAIVEAHSGTIRVEAFSGDAVVTSSVVDGSGEGSSDVNGADISGARVDSAAQKFRQHGTRFIIELPLGNPPTIELELRE